MFIKDSLAVYHVQQLIGSIPQVWPPSSDLTNTNFSAFKTWYKVAQGLSAVGLAICVFLVISWLLLPTERNKSHYLGICLVIGIALECVSSSEFFKVNHSNSSSLLLLFLSASHITLATMRSRQTI